MIQPASVDVRIDRFFRLFDNHKYPHIDPSQEQEELTRLVFDRLKDGPIGKDKKKKKSTKDEDEDEE